LAISSGFTIKEQNLGFMTVLADEVICTGTAAEVAPIPGSTAASSGPEARPGNKAADERIKAVAEKEGTRSLTGIR
jgi:hypothetical protein